MSKLFIYTFPKLFLKPSFVFLTLEKIATDLKFEFDLSPAVKEQPRDLDMAVHAGLHQRSVHLVSFVLLKW